MEKYLYHATTCIFSQFHANLHWEETGHSYGKGIYLIADDFGQETDFYRDIDRDITVSVISINDSGYISEKIYFQAIWEKFGHPAQHTSQYNILTGLYQIACSGKLSVDNALQKILQFPAISEKDVQTHKDYIQNIAQYFNHKKFKFSTVQQHQEGRLLKVKLLSDENIVNGMISLRENGYHSIRPNQVYRVFDIEKPDFEKPVTRKEVVTFLYTAQDWIYSLLKYQKSEAVKKIYFDLEDLTLQLNKKTEDNQPDSTQLTPQHYQAIEMTDALIASLFLNTPYFRLTRLSNNIFHQELGIKGMYFPHKNHNNGKNTTWYIIQDTSLLKIIAYKNAKTQWNWQPIQSPHTRSAINTQNPLNERS